ncbi:major surface trophozoite antigen 11-like [Ruditapes philippinarum]|uniref:major surface trophozoite antigen 11-like n=1 Tax=Ruditapes philippinarum TaxID=129788 RepID=UPI00295BF42C|nr:major surface trophozoite antigen 11-like [Ruditapes philippinarum]
MKWSLNLTLFVWCIWLNVSKNQVEGEINEQCLEDCGCCIDRKCGPGHNFPDECTFGCINGHRGARCYELCTYNCTECPYRADECSSCYDGYYPGPARDCTSECLPGCKTCTSGTTCTSCKDGYDNAVGQNDCSNQCNNSQCESCKD